MNLQGIWRLKIKGHWNVMCDKKLQTKLLKLNQG